MGLGGEVKERKKTYDVGQSLLQTLLGPDHVSALIAQTKADLERMKHENRSGQEVGGGTTRRGVFTGDESLANWNGNSRKPF